jgi:hypothetical protein
MSTGYIQTSAVVAAAMIVGGAATYFFVGKSSVTVTTLTTSAAVPPPPLIAEIAPAKVPEKTPVEQFTVKFDTELDAAIAAAKAERVSGNLKPLAKNTDEFARALGAINFRLHDFGERFEEPPASDDTEFSAYSRELKQLTIDLANLLSDEALMDQIEDGDIKALAHHQALMAAGALALDDATAAKVESIIAGAYEKALPADLGDREMTAEEEAAFDEKFDSLTATIEAEIRPLLSPEQTKRLEALGPEQVLFGLSGE